MRARWLKPEFFTDKKIAQLGPVAALVYEALWCMADDGGTAPCDADTVKAQMFYRWGAVGVPEISGALHALAGAGRIVRYQVGDDALCTIPTWEEHQQVHKPSKFRHPSMAEGVALPVPGECGTPTAPVPASPPPRHRDSQTPRHPDTSAPRRAAVRGKSADAAFETLWAIYPKRAGGNPKAAALKAYRARLTAGVTHAELAAGLERYAAYCAATGKVGTEFVKQAVTFFAADDEAWKELWATPSTNGARSHAGATISEAAAKAHEQSVRLADRYQAAAHRAGAVWARDNPHEFDQIKAAVERPYAGKTGDWIASAIKAELTQRCARAAGFQPFDAWRSTTTLTGAPA